MSHFKNLLLLFVVVLLFNNNSKSQVVNAKAEDFKDICNRPLIVQLITEDAYFVEDLQKRISKTSNGKRKEELEGELSAYRDFVTAYNSQIKEAIAKDWQFNKEKPIEYKTFSEVQDIRKVNSRNYTLLQFVQTKLWVTNEYGIETFTKKTIPTMVYSRMENCVPFDENFNKKIDYSFYMPYINSRKNHQLYVSDLLISLKIIQNHIKEIRNFDKKNYTVMDYAKDQDDENCIKLKSVTLLLDEKLLDTKTKSTDLLKIYSGKINIISTDEISKIINNQEEEIVSISLPFSMKSEKSGIEGLEFMERIMYMKCFVNAKSGVFFSSYIAKTGDNWEPLFKIQEFKRIEKCK
ncbi:MAG: hypothetical protein HXX18_01065 [Bacteroidetes bacterium]|nr:hypothetical protein [Bacteroidota bacterium]